MKKLRNKRMFICPDTLSTIALEVPDKKYVFDNTYEVTMRDCSRQIHWIFDNSKKGLTKVTKVAKFYNELQAEIERSIAEEAAKVKEKPKATKKALRRLS